MSRLLLLVTLLLASCGQQTTTGDVRFDCLDPGSRGSDPTSIYPCTAALRDGWSLSKEGETRTHLLDSGGRVVVRYVVAIATDGERAAFEEVGGERYVLADGELLGPSETDAALGWSDGTVAPAWTDLTPRD